MFLKMLVTLSLVLLGYMPHPFTTWFILPYINLSLSLSNTQNWCNPEQHNLLAVDWPARCRALIFVLGIIFPFIYPKSELCFLNLILKYSTTMKKGKNKKQQFNELSQSKYPQNHSLNQELELCLLLPHLHDYPLPPL